MNPALLITALLMGLAGSLHCAGMCGPIVWVMPFQQFSGIKRGLGIALYHFGRISVYAVLGFMLHLFKGLFHPQWQQYVSIVAGLVLLALGLLYFLPQAGVRFKLPWTGAVQKGIGKVMAQRHPAWLMAAGALNGFLPCGMVYMALAAAVSVPETWQAAAMMYAFGLGTAPMMVAITLLRTKAPLRAISVRKWTPVIMLLFGCLFVLRGANLGIPYLSPKAEMAKTTQEVPKMNCCHKTH
jgi:sulfite exporter TauE/SafE